MTGSSATTWIVLVMRFTQEIPNVWKAPHLRHFRPHVFLGWGWTQSTMLHEMIEDYGRAKSRNLDRPDRSSRFLLGHISMPFAWGRLGPKDPSFRFGAKHPSFPHDIIIFVKYIPFVFFLLFMMLVVKKAYTHWRVRTCLRPLNVQISTYS